MPLHNFHFHLKGGSGPVLQSSSGCHYEVIWETEHACPVANQVSSTCNISTQDGVFDLRILKREAEYYKTMYQDPKSKTKYTYFMNVCGNMKDFPCGSSNGECALFCSLFSNICRLIEHDVSAFAELHSHDICIDLNEMLIILKEEPYLGIEI